MSEAVGSLKALRATDPAVYAAIRAEEKRQREKLLGRLDCIVGVDAARAFMTIDELVRLFRPALVSEVVKIDSQ